MNQAFNLLYGFPQVFALLALLGFVFPPFFLFLVLCLPFPSPTRTWLEYRGYCMSITVRYLMTGDVPDYFLTRILDNFTGSNYYWMWPFRSHLMKLFRSHIKRIKEGRFIGLEREAVKILRGS